MIAGDDSRTNECPIRMFDHDSRYLVNFNSPINQSFILPSLPLLTLCATDAFFNGRMRVNGHNCKKREGALGRLRTTKLETLLLVRNLIKIARSFPCIGPITNWE